MISNRSQMSAWALPIGAALTLFVCSTSMLAQSIDASTLSNAFVTAAESSKRSVVSINVGVNKALRKRIKHFAEHARERGEDFDLDDLPSGSVDRKSVV